MFIDNQDTDFTLEQWIACRDFYLFVSRDPRLPENVQWACKYLARFAAENVRRITRDIEGLELLWALPEHEWRF